MQKQKRTRRVPAKKVSRACIHCRNAHITCDDNRPCARCVKKGLQETCVDAPRKVKKYLIGEKLDPIANLLDHAPQSEPMAVSKSLPIFKSASTSSLFNNTTQKQPTAGNTTRLPNTPVLGNPSINPIMNPHNSYNRIADYSQLHNNTSSVAASLQYPNTNTPSVDTDRPHLNNLPNPNIPLSMHEHPNSKTDYRLPWNMGVNRVTSPRQRMSPPTMSNGFIKTTNGNPPSIDGALNSTDEINFLSSAADSEYAILGNIIDQSLFQNSNPANNTSRTNSTSTNGHGQKYLSPALSANSDDLEYLNYQPLMTQNSSTSTTSPLVIGASHHNSSDERSNSDLSLNKSGLDSPFLKPLLPIDMRIRNDTKLKNAHFPRNIMNDTKTNENIGGLQVERENEKEKELENENGNGNEMEKAKQNTHNERIENHEPKNDNVGVRLKYSDLYPDQPHCDTATNQYFIGTMSTIDGIKTHTFPEVVKQISKFKREHPKKFRERNKRSAISFSIGITDDSNPEIENSESPDGKKDAIETLSESSARCGLLYHEPSEIYEKVKSPFTYVKPYHELNLYLKSRFTKQDLVHVSKSIAEYRPSFIAGMIKLKEDDLIFAEQCFQRTLLEYDSYIGISGTPTLVWRRTSQIAYVGDEFCVLTGWSKDDLLTKSTFAVEIMDDKSCVEYFKIFSKIAFGDMSGDTMTECTLLTPKGENIRTSCTWTLKRDVFGIPMMIIATFLPILT